MAASSTATSEIYDAVATLRRSGESLTVARVGRMTSRRFMILNPNGAPAWPHEPFGSLSDVGWSLRAQGWHEVLPEAVGPSAAPAARLARILLERA